MRNVIQEKIGSSLEYAAVAFLVALSVMLLSPRSRTSWRIMAGSALLGWMVGYGATTISVIAPVAVLLTVITTMTAPATIMKFQNKALDELFRELQDIIKKK